MSNLKVRHEIIDFRVRWLDQALIMNRLICLERVLCTSTEKLPRRAQLQETVIGWQVV